MASTSNNARTLLRAERLSRRITHPYASYTTAGTLSCTICNLRLQADSLWEPHLAGKVHRTNLAKRRENGENLAKEVPIREVELGNTNATTKKRKAEDDEDAEVTMGKKRKAEEEDSSRESTVRKIAKPVSRGVLPEGFFDSSSVKTKGVKNVHFQDGPDLVAEAESESTTARPEDRAESGTKSQDIDDEYASFEAALASATTVIAEPDPPQSTHIYTSNASISAAPMSAVDLAAAKSAEEAQSQRGRGREEEIEGEKEDAARALEEEFDEMDALEARVRRLKEMRERIRTEAVDVTKLDDVEDGIGGKEEADGENSSGDDDDDDDYDDWTLR